jgi:CIC family chloride channel protein
VGAIGMFLPHVYGNGYETTVHLLDGHYAVGFIAGLLLMKIVATSLTVGSGGSGGVFTPTLLVGAAAGALVGKLAHAVAPGHTAEPAAYALVGMAALLAATTHAPLLATVFVFEVTRDYAIVLPLLLTGYIAAGFAKALRPHSIYEEEAHRRGVDLGRNLELRALAALRADALVRPVPVLPATMPLVSVLETFAKTRATTLHVADETGKLQGIVDLHSAREEVVSEGATPPTAGKLARKVPTVSPGAPGGKVLDTLYRSGREEVPVVDRDGHLAGVVTRRQLEAAVDREVIRRGLRLHEPIGAPETVAAVDDLLAAPARSRLEQVRVPRLLEGKRIGEARVREAFGINIIAVTSVRPDGGEDLRLADAATLLKPGEDLVVIGSPSDIERFRGSI